MQLNKLQQFYILSRTCSTNW